MYDSDIYLNGFNNVVIPKQYMGGKGRGGVQAVQSRCIHSVC